MRGHNRAYCVALSLFALAATPSLASDNSQPVPLRLVAPAPVSRTAEDYLAGSNYTLATAGAFGQSFAAEQILPPIGVDSLYGPPGPTDSSLQNLGVQLAIAPSLDLDLGYRVDDAARFSFLSPSSGDYSGL